MHVVGKKNGHLTLKTLLNQGFWDKSPFCHEFYTFLGSGHGRELSPEKICFSDAFLKESIQKLGFHSD